jgi:hypothetical protein
VTGLAALKLALPAWLAPIVTGLVSPTVSRLPDDKLALPEITAKVTGSPDEAVAFRAMAVPTVTVPSGGNVMA